jgi:O-antigen/teichoic acid export membrane protein
MRTKISMGLRMYPYQVAMFLSYRVDVVLVASLAGVAAAGQYAVAVTVAEFVWLTASAVGYPLVQRVAGPDDVIAARETIRIVRMSVLVAVVIALGIGGTVIFAIAPAFGQAFAPARDAVWALLPGMVALVAWRTSAGLLVRSGDIGPMSWGAATALGGNVALCLLLIPSLDIVGAGIATSVSYALAALLAVLSLRARHGIDPAALVPRRREVVRLVRSLRPANLRRELRPARERPS